MRKTGAIWEDNNGDRIGVMDQKTLRVRTRINTNFSFDYGSEDEAIYIKDEDNEALMVYKDSKYDVMEGFPEYDDSIYEDEDDSVTGDKGQHPRQWGQRPTQRGLHPGHMGKNQHPIIK